MNQINTESKKKEGKNYTIYSNHRVENLSTHEDKKIKLKIIPLIILKTRRNHSNIIENLSSNFNGKLHVKTFETRSSKHLIKLGYGPVRTERTALYEK